MSRSLNDDVARATSDERSEVDWALIMDICDRVNSSTNGPAEVMKAVRKRLADSRGVVVLHSLDLLGALVENCGKQLHLQVCTRDFVTEARRLAKLTGPQLKIAEKMKELIEKWTFTNFKGDAELGIIEHDLYRKLKTEGVHFSSSTKSGPSPASSSVSRPAAGTDSQMLEDEQLARAIQLSLNESSSSTVSQPAPAASSGPSLYPQLGGNRVPSPTPARRAPTELRKVRALFDFEAAEDNELSFKAGELIGILDDSDPNWWRGQTYEGGIGLFPANFVTPDLSVPPPAPQVMNRQTRYADTTTITEQAKKKPEISEEKIDLLMEMLKNADATDTNDEEDATVKDLES